MTAEERDRVNNLASRMPALTGGQLNWIERVVTIFESWHTFSLLQTGILNDEALNNFGDALRIHHGFSREPFSKDKFEYVLEHSLLLSGVTAVLAPRGLSGHDIKIEGKRVSLKTQADRNIKEDVIWISKFMELGKGVWGDSVRDLEGLRESFLKHLKAYDDILVLRCLQRQPRWRYELVQIPLQILRLAKRGRLEMRTESIQYPKPGYCFVETKDGEEIFQMYFDAGSERKLQIKSLKKAFCTVLADWEFEIPEELM